MADDTKVTETHVVSTKPSESESFIESTAARREAVEQKIIAENAEVPEEIVASETPAETAPETTPPAEETPIDRIKKSVQKRIDKVVAKQKSAEDELAEARAEIERLRAKPAETSKPAETKAPTVEEVEAYIVRMSEEGNKKEEVAAIRYLIKLEKEIAMKEIADQQAQTQQQASSKKEKELADWTDLQRDYIVVDATGKVDAKHDLNLANQNGLLYKTSIGLYNDKELHKDFYDDTNPIQGFRRAVADAYRELHQQGLIKSTPKVEPVVRRNPREVLADPDADSGGDETPAANTASLSDADKVREEIKARNKNRYKR